MATTITYTDLDGAAPKITWHGRDFVSEKPIEVDDEQDAALIEAAEGNAWFEVKSGGAPKPDGKSPYDKGYKAAADGKDKSIPVAWRGKPEGTAWLTGYDDGAKATGRTAPDQTATVGGPISPGAAANAV